MTKVKTLEDVKADMSALYEELRKGEVEIKMAAELANITGKYLKAEQLKLAREVFEANKAQPLVLTRQAEPQLVAAE